MLASSMPNAATSSAFVDTATKCLATAFSSPPSPLEQPVRGPTVALVSVSSVVKVLDETMKSVVAGSRSRSASETSVGSMLETKRNVSVAVARSRCSAS